MARLSKNPNLPEAVSHKQGENRVCAQPGDIVITLEKKLGRLERLQQCAMCGVVWVLAGKTVARSDEPSREVREGLYPRWAADVQRCTFFT